MNFGDVYASFFIITVYSFATLCLSKLLFMCSDVRRLRPRACGRGAAQHAGHQCSNGELYNRLMFTLEVLS